MTKQEFVSKYWADAQAGCKGSGIFPLLALAQSALESGWGSSGLTVEANNFFGLKSTPSWEGIGGKWILKPTHEFVDGKTIEVTARFRKYDTPADCYRNYVHFVTQPNYKAHGVLNAATPEEQITCIAAAGYATDPHYAAKVIGEMMLLKGLLPALTFG